MTSEPRDTAPPSPTYVPAACKECNGTVYVESPMGRHPVHEDPMDCVRNLQARIAKGGEAYGRLTMTNMRLQERAHLAESRALRAERAVKRLAPLTHIEEAS